LRRARDSLLQAFYFHGLHLCKQLHIIHIASAHSPTVRLSTKGLAFSSASTSHTPSTTFRLCLLTFASLVYTRRPNKGSSISTAASFRVQYLLYSATEGRLRQLLYLSEQIGSDRELWTSNSNRNNATILVLWNHVPFSFWFSKHVVVSLDSVDLVRVRVKNLATVRKFRETYCHVSCLCQSSPCERQESCNCKYVNSGSRDSLV
jgi:hypothetical protein